MSKNKIYYSKKKFYIFFLILLLLFLNLNLFGQQSDGQKQQESIIKDINQGLENQKSTETKQNNNSIVSFFIRTLIVLLILVIAYLLIKYRFSKTIENKNSDKYFNILLKQQISRNLSLGILEFFGSYYIISIGTDITILEKIENQEIIDSIKLEAGKEQSKKTFFDYLGISTEKVEKSKVIVKFDELKEKMTKLKKGKTE